MKAVAFVCFFFFSNACTCIVVAHERDKETKGKAGIQRKKSLNGFDRAGSESYMHICMYVCLFQNHVYSFFFFFYILFFFVCFQ